MKLIKGADIIKGMLLLLKSKYTNHFILLTTTSSLYKADVDLWSYDCVIVYFTYYQYGAYNSIKPGKNITFFYAPRNYHYYELDNQKDMIEI